MAARSPAGAGSCFLGFWDLEFSGMVTAKPLEIPRFKQQNTSGRGRGSACSSERPVQQYNDKSIV